MERYIYQFGNYNNLYKGYVFVEIRDKEEGPELSITAGYGPSRDCVAIGAGVKDIIGYWMNERYGNRLSEEWEEILLRLFEVADKYHLNTLTPGSPLQEAAIDMWKRHHEYSYDAACEYLKTLGIYEDKTYIHNGKPYKYGHAWLYTPIPEDVLEFVRHLPDPVEPDKAFKWARY